MSRIRRKAPSRNNAEKAAKVAGRTQRRCATPLLNVVVDVAACVVVVVVVVVAVDAMEASEVRLASAKVTLAPSLREIFRYGTVVVGAPDDVLVVVVVVVGVFVVAVGFFVVGIVVVVVVGACIAGSTLVLKTFFVTKNNDKMLKSKENAV